MYLTKKSAIQLMTSNRFKLIVFVLIFEMLHVSMLLWARPAIEEDLVTRSVELLRKKGFSQIDVFANGRDLIIAGAVGGEVERGQIISLLSHVSGVRIVTEKLAVHHDRLPHIDINLDGERVILEGELPSSYMADRIVDAIKGEMNVGIIDNKVSIRTEVDRPEWLETLLNLLQPVAKMKDAGISIGAGQLIVAGILKSEKEYQDVMHHIKLNVDDVNISLEVSSESFLAKIDAIAIIEFSSGILLSRYSWPTSPVRSWA